MSSAHTALNQAPKGLATRKTLHDGLRLLTRQHELRIVRAYASRRAFMRLNHDRQACAL